MDEIMKNIKKFENFLESLKGKGQDALIESVKTGFRACLEASDYEHRLDAGKNLALIWKLQDLEKVIGDEVTSEEEFLKMSKEELQTKTLDLVQRASQLLKQNPHL